MDGDKRNIKDSRLLDDLRRWLTIEKKVKYFEIDVPDRNISKKNIEDMITFDYLDYTFSIIQFKKS